MNAPDAPTDELNLRPILWRMLLAILAVTLLAGAAGWFVADEVVELGTSFVESFGLWGIAASFFIPDTTAIPIPPEPFLALGLAGGIPYWKIVLAASAGSILGGSLAFGASRLLRRVPWVHKKLEARAETVHALVDRYGVRAVVIGAVTPLPYSLIAWTAGVMGMPYRTFLVVSLLRVPRIAFYLMLMWLGLGGAGGP